MHLEKIRFENLEVMQVAQSSFQRRDTASFELRIPLQFKLILDQLITYQLFKKHSNSGNYGVRVYNVTF